jgi:hypothetical protein
LTNLRLAKMVDHPGLTLTSAFRAAYFRVPIPVTAFSWFAWLRGIEVRILHGPPFSKICPESIVFSQNTVLQLKML